MNVLMWIGAILGITLGLFVIFVLFSKITIRAVFVKKSGEPLGTSLEIMALGGLFKKELSKDKLPQKHKSIQKKQASSLPEKNDAKFFDRVKKGYKRFLMLKELYSQNKSKIRRGVHATRLQLHLEFGLGDAAETGIATGAVWAGVYNVVAFVSRHIRITEPEIRVVPEYNQKKCSLKGECIIKARVVNLIITAASIGIGYYFKNKKLNKGGE